MSRSSCCTSARSFTCWRPGIFIFLASLSLWTRRLRTPRLVPPVNSWRTKLRSYSFSFLIIELRGRRYAGYGKDLPHGPRQPHIHSAPLWAIIGVCAPDGCLAQSDFQGIAFVDDSSWRTRSLSSAAAGRFMVVYARAVSRNLRGR